MLITVKQVFLALLSFIGFFATKYMSLNNKPCMTRLTMIEWNHIELNYPFMISVDRFFGNCNVADDLSMKICVPSETNDISIRLFDIVTRINETKTLVKRYFEIF